ncbi:MAG: hypothetical protein IPL75_11745 [Acidobacteria bacterium]|nr:hypothetical protein [Acidobacteriota bacterium]
MSNENDSGSSAIMDFFRRPEVGIAGSVASIISIGLSVYFFLASSETPELTYFVHPVKAAVVRTGQASGLSVQFDGQVLRSDITATQIAFWNAGRRPIRGSAILSPLVIRTGNGERILEARIRKTSRDVAGVVLDSSRMASGEVEIRWSILEQNDGGVLQLVYAGNEAVELEARAVLEGQPQLVQLEYARQISTPDEQYSRRLTWQGQLPTYMMGGIGAVMTVMGPWMILRKRRRGQKMRPSDWFTFLQGPIMIAMAIWFLVSEGAPGPPFGF